MEFLGEINIVTPQQCLVVFVADLDIGVLQFFVIPNDDMVCLVVFEIYRRTTVGIVGAAHVNQVIVLRDHLEPHQLSIFLVGKEGQNVGPPRDIHFAATHAKLK